MDNRTKYEHPDFFLFLNLYFFFRDCETRALNKYNAAKGVGLQIIYEDNPIQFNHWFTLKKVSDSKSIPLPFYAQYIQVAERVTPGQANALVTYHIKYH
ncbi:hypothetical protein CBG25_06675 [Arsenophonus sp. ENCA]|uniref:fimbrial protein n=1 Tax=Arsenophonus sp. ENCA TaxID=1987579 RepID=UPI000BD8A62E|nr:fimbrial protein [Arsenophonus sp. ENCA]PAV05253.1 hypothetical protein CBG25_06675 [Arsenophonus sp. ENCA]